MQTDLVVRARHGDQQAFASLAADVYERLHTVAHGILRDRELAEDAIQGALLTIWRELPRLRDESRFEAWSYRLLVNACYRQVRRERRWSPALRSAELAEPISPAEIDVVADRDELERGFRRLSVDHRAVIVLQYYLGLSPAEVAKALDVPVGTVHSRLHHAMRQLRAALQADARAVAPDGAMDGAAR